MQNSLSKAQANYNESSCLSSQLSNVIYRYKCNKLGKICLYTWEYFMQRLEVNGPLPARMRAFV